MDGLSQYSLSYDQTLGAHVAFACWRMDCRSPTLQSRILIARDAGGNISDRTLSGDMQPQRRDFSCATLTWKGFGSPQKWFRKSKSYNVFATFAWQRGNLMNILFTLHIGTTWAKMKARSCDRLLWRDWQRYRKQQQSCAWTEAFTD